jgi:hypothetical protein
MRNHEDGKIALVEITLGQVEDLVRKALFVAKVKEVGRQKADGEEALDNLFANEESQLVLKDERSS